MNVESVSLFLALLAILSELATVVALVLAIGRRFSARLAVAAHDLTVAVAPHALALAFSVAAVATAGSLYFSEVAHFTPCRLCWYQRICMYPLVPILGIAAWRRDRAVRPYAAVLAAVGVAISSYHVLVERYPSLEGNACDPTNPCTIIWVRRFGYLTIPTMALSGFLLILTLLAVARPSTDDSVERTAGRAAFDLPA